MTESLKFGVEMGAYKVGERQLENWRFRAGSRRHDKVAKDTATTTVRVNKYGERVLYRGSGFYAGACR